jgi:hypothetical protein
MKSDLIAWCSDRSRTTAGRLVHGPGGLGKTRLMIEVASALREKGWTAGFLDRPHEQVESTLRQRWQALDQLIAQSDENGLLIVIDYAESRQDEVKLLAERVRRRPDSHARPIRFIFLARTAGEWWTTLHDETPDIQILFRRDARGAGVIELSSFATGEQRRELFFASVAAMKPTLTAQGYLLRSGSEPSAELLARIKDGESRPLAVAKEETVAGVADLLGYVLGLERAHWRKLLGALDEDRVRDVARGVAQATVVQGTDSRPSTEVLLMADKFYGAQRRSRVSVDPVVRSLLRLYGKPNDGVRPLEPDLVGEHHSAAVADVELIDGCLEWIASSPAEEHAKYRKDFLTVLQRATAPDHGAMAARASRLLDHLVGHHARILAIFGKALCVLGHAALSSHLQSRALRRTARGRF